MKVLEELLVMGKVGVFVDAPHVAGDTLADVEHYRPYLYVYKLEKISPTPVRVQRSPASFSQSSWKTRSRPTMA